jgi:hypothetical protein
MMTFVDEKGHTKMFSYTPSMTVGELVLRIKFRYSFDENVYSECSVVDASGRVLEIWDSETVQKLIQRTQSSTLWYQKKWATQ